MLLEYAYDDAGIGHPRDFDAAQVIVNTEALLESGFERVHASTSRMDQCAVYVEEKQTVVQNLIGI